MINYGLFQDGVPTCPDPAGSERVVEEAVLACVMGQFAGTPVPVLALALRIGGTEGAAVEQAVVSLVGRGVLAMDGRLVVPGPQFGADCGAP